MKQYPITKVKKIIDYEKKRNQLKICTTLCLMTILITIPLSHYAIIKDIAWLGWTMGSINALLFIILIIFKARMYK